MNKIKTSKGTYIDDITGHVFSRLTVISLTDGKDNDNRWIWKCRCSCENRTIVYCSMHKLRSGNTKSCGCLQRESVIKKNKNGALDISGMRIGKLEVIRKDENKNNSWICKCDCGNVTSVALGELRRGLYSDKAKHGTYSCGCIRKSCGEERISSILGGMNEPYIREKHLMVVLTSINLDLIFT